MTLGECVLRAYYFLGGRADNAQISAYVADRRPESRQSLHERLIPGAVQVLKNRGYLVNVVKGRAGQFGVWRLTAAGQQAAQSLVNPS